MLDVTYYRLPDSSVYHVVRGKAETFESLPDLEHCEGFIMAPFSAGSDTPYVVIPPQISSVHHVPSRVKKYELHWTEMDNKTLYKQNFHDMHAMLEKDILDKIVLSRRVDCRIDDWSCTPEQLFRKACVMYPHQMTAMVVTDVTGIWFMSTPEVLLKRNEEHWETMALAGTKPLATDEPWSEKEIREQQLVVDYISSTIRPLVAEMNIGEPYTSYAARLRHRRTDISFRLCDGATVNNLIEVLHPTPAVCGLPKDTAFGAIRSFESIDRRYYSGFCGPWGIGGDNALYVSLRCMEIEGDRNFHLYAGGGLLKESDARSEWMETEDKMNTMRNVLR